MARIGTTNRGGPRNPDPLRHVWTPYPATPTGRCRQALCGRGQIRPAPRDDLGEFDINHPRSCQDCVARMLARAGNVARRHAT
jgi:hypothetical protein